MTLNQHRALHSFFQRIEDEDGEKCIFSRLSPITGTRWTYVGLDAYSVGQVGQKPLKKNRYKQDDIGDYDERGPVTFNRGTRSERKVY